MKFSVTRIQIYISTLGNRDDVVMFILYNRSDLLTLLIGLELNMVNYCYDVFEINTVILTFEK